MSDSQDKRQKLIEVTLDERSVVRRSSEIEHERKVAIFDLLEDNSFSPVGHDGGPYRLRLGIEENRLIFDIQSDTAEPVGRIGLSLTSFRSTIKDYFAICESYFQAIKTATPSRIEAIDMGRRGIHNDGSQILKDRLEGKITIDFDTARRLFTLICVLHIRV